MVEMKVGGRTSMMKMDVCGEDSEGGGDDEHGRDDEGGGDEHSGDR